MHYIASAAKPHPWSRRKEPWLQAKLASRNFLSARLGAIHCLHVVHPRIEDRSLGCWQTSFTESKTGTLLATRNEQGRTSYLLDQARPIVFRLFIHGIEDKNLGCESELSSRDFFGRSPQSRTLQTPSAAFTREPGIFCDALHRHCYQTSSMESKKGTFGCKQN